MTDHNAALATPNAAATPAGPSVPAAVELPPVDRDAASAASDPGTGDLGRQNNDGDRRRNPGAEAANYRRQLRDVETERDTLTEQLATSRRQHVEALLAAGSDLRPNREGDAVPTLHDPADLWGILGVDVASLYDDDGSLDREVLATHLREAATARPYLTRVPAAPASVLLELASRGRRGSTPEGSGSPWADALSPN